ncbi:MAG: hypothetical protein ACK5OX_13390 [Desertimonas sp.]
MSAGLYEQIKADLGYLNLDAAAGSFALLAEEARTNDWSHVEFLARLVGEQATADRNRRLAARLRYARFRGFLKIRAGSGLSDGLCKRRDLKVRGEEPWAGEDHSDDYNHHFYF